ncbi:MAG: ATP-binding protein, partial [Oceanococcaceae bacterium]
NAALAALAEGRPRISGPIQLVQDSLSRPGFLFYEPFVVTAPDRDGRRYTGLVYAPFVVADLVEGALQPSQRNVTFSLRDGDRLLYGDSTATTSTFDAYPMFESVITLPMYGREWTFHIASGRPYREGALTSLPGLILLGGLSVNLLLIAFFGLLVQSSRAAEERAAHASVQHERAQRELLQRNEELVQFNYRVSHDLVAPMRSISGLLDILRLDLEDQEYGNVEQAVAQMQTEVTKQIRVISSIFRLSEADLREEEYRWFAVRPLAIELFETATRDEQATDVALRLQVPDDFYVYAPESRLRLALGNIISNAVRFRREGEQQPRVDVRAEMNGNEYVIRVRDNGIGIPAELQPKVFDLFFRAHSHAKSGTGLGAYIARKSLERMDGEIEVFSDAEGSAFELRWPHPAGAASVPPPISSGEPPL